MMTNDPTRTNPHVHRGLAATAAFCVGGLGVLTACGVLRADAAPKPSAAESRQMVSEVSGWTRAVTTAHYLVVVNVLPSEHMMTRAEMNAMHPTEGELIINGEGLPQGTAIRHVEAHIYDRSTGKALTGVVPTLKLVNRTTGETIDVPPTLMQDVIIGPLDLHFGNNVPVVGNSDISVQVTVAGEEVSVDGHLD